ncbi:MAG: Na(+)/H(+) antiporter subunit D [Maricaulaceae bacterium]
MTELLLNLNPGILIILAGIICAVMPASQIRKLLVLAAPIAGVVSISMLYTDQEVIGGLIEIGGQTFTTLRIDSLSLIWGYIFCVVGVLNGIYGLHEKCQITDSSALIYMGAAIGGVFAGDLLTLFIFWEIAAVSSVPLIWKGGERAYAAGVRYLAIHIFSGVALLAGAIMYGRANGGDFAFNHIGLESPGGWLMLIAMGIKCGFPLMHNWIQDAYPKASITGTVILSAFTTKLAIYALARGFAGEDILIYIGAAMTIFPVFFAVIENDMRRVLAYSLNNQLGYMVCGIGVGTTLAMNGVAGQVAVHIIFKSLLFMSMGAVLYRVGTIKGSELGGLFRSMPITTICCLIGAASIAAFPLFAAFVTKAMIISAVIKEHHYVISFILLFASAGVMEHSGIKIPYFTFFSHDSGKRVEEAPWNMLVAMGLASLLCIVFAFPFGGYQLLYNLMPYTADYDPYTADHVVFQLQLLFAAILAFALLKRLKVYPAERRAEIIDFDWTYRKLGLSVVKWLGAMWARLDAFTAHNRDRIVGTLGQRLKQVFSPVGAFSSASPANLSYVVTGMMLLVGLITVYLGAR